MVSSKSVLPADSFEIWRELHLEQIRLLQERLFGLNLQDNPCEIQAICSEIIIIKAMISIRTRSLERRS